MCSGGPKGNHFTCPPGRSFNPDSKFGSCTGPPPSEVKACFKNEGFLINFRFVLTIKAFMNTFF